MMYLRKKTFIFSVSQLIISIVFSQNIQYSVSNAHSHNDYEQKKPFWAAYSEGFGSIEADVYLVDSNLYVAHNPVELQKRITLDSEYLKPLWTCLSKNNNHPYSDSLKHLQMLIDLKSEPDSTLKALITLLSAYPSLIKNRLLSWVITGKRPSDSLYIHYPDFIYFDGEITKEYSKEALQKILLLSCNFEQFSDWKGIGEISPRSDSILKAVVLKAKLLGKPVRFWGAPDNLNAWKYFQSLQVGYINTDHIADLAFYLNKFSK